jgi:hypothetical protein
MEEASSSLVSSTTATVASNNSTIGPILRWLGLGFAAVVVVVLVGLLIWWAVSAAFPPTPPSPPGPEPVQPLETFAYVLPSSQQFTVTLAQLMAQPVPWASGTTGATGPVNGGTLGSMMATRAQALDAYNRGAAWCIYLPVQTSSSSYELVYPYNSPTIPAACIQGFNENRQQSVDANSPVAGILLFGVKPPFGTSNVLPFNTVTGTWNQPAPKIATATTPFYQTQKMPPQRYSLPTL